MSDAKRSFSKTEKVFLTKYRTFVDIELSRLRVERDEFISKVIKHEKEVPFVVGKILDKMAKYTEELRSFEINITHAEDIIKDLNELLDQSTD